MTITYDAKIAARGAFSCRRQELLTRWLAAPVTDRSFWAERLLLINDAEIAIFGMLYDAEIAVWESRRRLSTSDVMQALSASLR